MNKGWECPKCGRCYAPHIVMCFNCNGGNSGIPATPKYPWQPIVTWKDGSGSVTTTNPYYTYTINAPTHSSNEIKDLTNKMNENIKKYFPDYYKDENYDQSNY